MAFLLLHGAAEAAYPPDRGQPGDEMIQQWLAAQSARLEADFLDTVTNAAAWERLRPQYKQQYLYMLGLWPLPEKTPLQAKVTRTLQGDGFTVQMLHYQSQPHLYVTANLYRPARPPAGKLPAVVYVCGHSSRPRSGNKAAYQSHGIWFARHGYVCLMLDTLQLGEIAAIHHGTYREGRWWWHSRGYTSAGVEAWNGIRAVDYLLSLPEVDPARIAVTGISGGGAATFWIAAADERVAVAVPVSGMADLDSYVTDRVVNGHCDCMFLYNTFAWPWTRIAALVAPRPLLFVNSDQDTIFPMDANERVINRLERLYSLFGAGDRVDAVVSIGGHAYRQDIRQAAYRFINSHLQGDPHPVTDSEADLVIDSGRQPTHPIDPEKLRVFPTDSDLPPDQINTRIDESFVPMARVEAPAPGAYAAWRTGLLEELRRVTFRNWPETLPAAQKVSGSTADALRVETEPGIQIPLRKLAGTPEKARRIILVVASTNGAADADWLGRAASETDLVYTVQPRGVGEIAWTRKNPPNYVERAHVLLGRTVDTGRVWDIVSAGEFLRQQGSSPVPVWVAGAGEAGVLAAYAMLLNPEFAGAILHEPILSHMDPSAPQFLNVLRVCDVPEVLGMLAPRSLAIRSGAPDRLRKTVSIYTTAGAKDRLLLE